MTSVESTTSYTRSDGTRYVYSRIHDPKNPLSRHTELRIESAPGHYKLDDYAWNYCTLPPKSDNSKEENSLENDIKIVMSQTDCTSEQAREALLNNTNDLVNAIFSLTCDKKIK